MLNRNLCDLNVCCAKRGIIELSRTKEEWRNYSPLHAVSKGAIHGQSGRQRWCERGNTWNSTETINIRKMLFILVKTDKEWGIQGNQILEIHWDEMSPWSSKRYCQLNHISE